jgi:hypothetical protein
VITDVRRQVLRNIHEGKMDPYDGFDGSQRGGAVRSMQMLRRPWVYLTYDYPTDRWSLTPAGIAAMEEQ